jgi:hypothetical protein
MKIPRVRRGSWVGFSADDDSRSGYSEATADGEVKRETTMKREPIREADISAHGLAFHVVMEPECTEEEFEIFCDDLQYTITNCCDAKKAAELRQGNDGCFLIDYDDGSFHDVDYDPQGGTLLVKKMMRFDPPMEVSGAGSAAQTVAKARGVSGRKHSTARRRCRMQ